MRCALCVAAYGMHSGAVIRDCANLRCRMYRQPGLTSRFSRAPTGAPSLQSRLREFYATPKSAVAHIKDQASGQWWRFDDEVAACIGPDPAAAFQSDHGAVGAAAAAAAAAGGTAADGSTKGAGGWHNADLQ